MDYLIPPWKHQLEAIERAKALPGFALFFEQGTGKTSTTNNILRHKYLEKKRLLRTLILCPPIVVQNWKREFQAHSKMDPKFVQMLIGHNVKRKTTFERFAYDEERKKRGMIFVTNYEALQMGELYEAILAWEPEVLVCDESHKLKAHTAKRTKAVIKLVDGEQKITKNHAGISERLWTRLPVKYRYLLSGTPVLNSPMDIYSQFRVLDGGKTFDKNFFAFRARYFYDKNALFRQKKSYFPDWQIKPGSLTEMNSLIYKSGMRVKKEECMDLPPLVRQRVDVELSPEQSRLYQEMKKELVTYLGDRACMAQMALTKALRLLQIVSGFASLEADGERAKTEKTLGLTPRQLALKELLETITPQHKVLVWAVFKENYGQIREVCKDLGIASVEVHGDTPTAKKHEHVDLFNRDPSVRVLIGHPGSGGIGINLVAASYSIFFSRSFSLEQDLQAEARNHRGGSEIHARITRIDIVATSTIDELVLEKLANKQAMSEEVLKEWRERL